MASAQALRALDIRNCIQCFGCLGKPCGELGRGLAVSCGVCLNNSRKCYCGCIPQFFNCCLRLCGSAAEVAVVVVGILLIGVIAIWLLYWNLSSNWEGGSVVEKVAVANTTLSYGDGGWIDLDELNATSNKTMSDDDEVNNSTDFGREQIGNHSDVTWSTNHTSKEHPDSKFYHIKNDKEIIEAISGPSGVWKWIKEKISG